MIIIFILGLILLSVGLILIYQAKNIKVQRTGQINKIQQEIKEKQQLIKQLTKDCSDYEQYIAEQKKELSQLLNQKFNITQKITQQERELADQYNNKQNILNKQLERDIQTTQKAFENYCNIIDQSYSKKENEINIKIQEKEKEQTQLKSRIAQIKSIYQAAAAARIREQEEQDKKSFYQIQIPKKQILDISKLEDWKHSLTQPSIVSKIIWSSYIMKPTSELCNRVLGSSIVCGIYKITNLLTKEVYVGQSVDIASRWKQHIKCGLGIVASSTNKLYNNMQEHGVWNFSFEVLQKCSRDKLNQKERFWIELYQSNKSGLNITKGVNK